MVVVSSKNACWIKNIHYSLNLEIFFGFKSLSAYFMLCFLRVFLFFCFSFIAGGISNSSFYCRWIAVVDGVDSINLQKYRLDCL